MRAGQRIRHLKRGSCYRVRGAGRIRMNACLLEDGMLIIPGPGSDLVGELGAEPGEEIGVQISETPAPEGRWVLYECERPEEGLPRFWMRQEREFPGRFDEPPAVGTMVARAQAAIAARYAKTLAEQDPGGDPLGHDARLSLTNLSWMCAEVAGRAEEWPADKAGRWLGFVQGCLAMRGLIDVDEERALTRPLLHAAYEGEGREPPETRERP